MVNLNIILCISIFTLSSTVTISQKNKFADENIQAKLNSSVNFYRNILEYNIQENQVDTVLCMFNLWLSSDSLNTASIESYTQLDRYLRRLDTNSFKRLTEHINPSYTIPDLESHIHECRCSAYDSAGRKLMTIDPFQMIIPYPDSLKGGYYFHDYQKEFYGTEFVLLMGGSSRYELVNSLWNAVWSPVMGLKWFKKKQAKVDTLFTTQEAISHRQGQFKFFVGD